MDTSWLHWACVAWCVQYNFVCWPPRLVACLPVCLIACLLACMLACWLADLLACSPAAGLLACWLPCLLACWRSPLACFPYSGIPSCPILSKHSPSLVQAVSKPPISAQASHETLLGIQVAATFGGLRVPQLRHPVMPHPVQSLSKRCPSCDQAPRISDQALAKRCPSCDQAPLISDQARPNTVLGVHVFVYFRGSAVPPKLPFDNIKRGNHL